MIDYVRPENLHAAAVCAREDYRNLTIEHLERRPRTMPWGTAAEVARRMIEAADSTGSNTVI